MLHKGNQPTETTQLFELLLPILVQSNVLLRDSNGIQTEVGECVSKISLLYLQKEHVSYAGSGTEVQSCLI